MAVFGLSQAWFDAGIAGDRIEKGGLALWALTIPVALASTVAAAVAISSGVRGHRPALAVPIITSTLAAAIVVYIAVIEVVAGLVASVLSPFIFPAIFRRYAFHLIAGPGAWMALAGLSCAALASVRWPPSPGRFGFSFKCRSDRVRIASLVLLVASCICLAWSRYEPWIQLSTIGNSTNAPGWVLPWIGPWSLFPVWILAISIVVAIASHSHIGALLAAGGGWFATFLTSIPIVVVGLASMHAVDNLLPTELRSSTSASSGIGMWMAYGAGLAAAIAGAGLILASIMSPTAEKQWA